MRRRKITLNTHGPGIIDGRQIRAAAFVPAREQLLDRILQERADLAHGSRRALVIGAGYSPLPSALRDRGFQTTAIDPSAEATAIAQAHTPQVDFRTASASGLKVEPASFDLVYCTDTLEVDDNLDGVLAAVEKAARPGAVVILDTVTDTAIAKLIYLLVFQRLWFTSIVPPGRYSSDRLRNPLELEEACRRAGLAVDTVIGFEPKSVGSLVQGLLKRRSGRITDEELAVLAGFHLSKANHAPLVTYFAVATKNRF